MLHNTQVDLIGAKKTGHESGRSISIHWSESGRETIPLASLWDTKGCMMPHAVNTYDHLKQDEVKNGGLGNNKPNYSVIVESMDIARMPHWRQERTTVLPMPRHARNVAASTTLRVYAAAKPNQNQGRKKVPFLCTTHCSTTSVSKDHGRHKISLDHN